MVERKGENTIPAPMILGYRTIYAGGGSWERMDLELCAPSYHYKCIWPYIYISLEQVKMISETRLQFSVLERSSKNVILSHHSYLYYRK